MSGSVDTKPKDSRGTARLSVRQRFLRNPLALISMGLLLCILLFSFMAPLLAPYAPNATKLLLVNAPPGAGYLLGGDGAGRDVLSRLMYAGRLTLAGSLLTVAVACVIGVATGLAAGYWGGRLDTVLSWIANFLIVLPGTIVLVAMFTLIGPNIPLAMAILGVLIAPNFFRLVRNLVAGIRNELYVDAARVSGLSDLRILSRHILQVVRAPIIIMAASVWGIAIVVQAGLEFLGLGDPQTPTWGSMLLDAYNNLYIGRHLLLPPGLMIGITVASLILIGNALRDALSGGSTDAPAATRRVRHPAQAATRNSAGDDPLLQVEDLRVAYHRQGAEPFEVVHGVGFSIRRGEILGLVGESGSGKTQTALSILQLLPRAGMITGGRIRLAGQDLLGLNAGQLRQLRGSRIGYIPQEPMSNLDPLFKIGSQLCEPMQAVKQMSPAAAKDKALSLLKRVGIADPARVFESYPHQVSGGMAQRVLIAGALSCDPELLIADEPTTALDVTVQAEILDLIRDLQAERQLGVLMVTHNFGVVADICDTVAVMRSGVIVEHRPVRDIFAAAQHDYTRSLLASTPEGAPLRPPLVARKPRHGWSPTREEAA